MNGIRKTTSINSSFFKKVLYEALANQLKEDITSEDLPCGDNSFFRQLDFIVATIANEEFKKLYDIQDVDLYAKLKNAIFSRYRTFAEICGMLLVERAVSKHMNVLVETSGRDIAMFEYIDFLFPDDKYNKLVVHFTIDDIRFAEKSVDTRMLYEMKSGIEDLDNGGGVLDLIKANAGGPYGSKELKGVLDQSEAVLRSVLSGTTDIGKSWYKAEIAINGSDDEPWTIRAKANGSTQYTFKSSIVFAGGGRADIRREVKY